MPKAPHDTPFHTGERAAQKRAGVGDVSQWAGGYIRDHLPEQHRDFHSSLPFLIAASDDSAGRIWVTVVQGDAGFITSPDPRRLHLQTRLSPDDPLSDRFANGGDIGAIGIELATRRRNRFSGRLSSAPDGYVIDISQTFGNCPQYIHARSLTRGPTTPAPPIRARHLSSDQISRIHCADTLFIGSGYTGKDEHASSGFDASHRGGAPGFVRVHSPTRLMIPDYIGNNFFNTIGNLLADGRVGLLFVDFETGGLLHLSGRATVDWSPQASHDPDAWRMIIVDIDHVVERPAAIPLRWFPQDHNTRALKITDRVSETETITSFRLAPADGRPLAPFKPGQHLPVTVHIPGQSAPSSRTYSLSGPATDRDSYRLTIKREDAGRVSRHLHDALQIGDVIETRAPSGGFLLPDGTYPVVLISAGVGLTPMVSMLHALARGTRPAWFLHATRNRAHHALRSEIATLVSTTPYLHQRVFYSRPRADDVRGRDFDIAGRITTQHVLDLGLGPDAQYLICGPAAFIADLNTGLCDAGLPADRISFETFGPSR